MPDVLMVVVFAALLLAAYSYGRIVERAKQQALRAAAITAAQRLAVLTYQRQLIDGLTVKRPPPQLANN